MVVEASSKWGNASIKSGVKMSGVVAALNKSDANRGRAVAPPDEGQYHEPISQGSGDERHAEARANAQARKVLAKREEERERIQKFFSRAAEVRKVQQDALLSPRNNAVKLKAGLSSSLARPPPGDVIPP